MISRVLTVVMFLGFGVLCLTGTVPIRDEFGRIAMFGVGVLSAICADWMAR